ncbi:alpha/beta fold hydrolase [Terribacillus sp. DMT04]|uniref:alpha/beta fold hydrolase n=1 Tax=Terribacillus sp. DMT04 TaxID=2850441 RepID=UPI001C2BFB2E|nr:alpha/beta hydrolase [Terribacillus sp. DMT04]QXE02186.1 alpha/beta fold hydrolase [Terribacillus sp. DMT04]
MHIHYETAGNQAKPALLLIHGLGWTNKIWEQVCDQLKENFYIIMIDLPGHGESEEADNYDFQMIADCIHNRISTIHVNSLYVAGSSLGAAAALAYASKYSTKGVLLIDGGFAALSQIKDLCIDDMTFEAPSASVLKTMHAYLQYMRQDDPELWNEHIASAAADQVILNKETGAYQLKASPAVQQKYLEAFYYFDPIKTLRQMEKSKKVVIMVALHNQQQKQDVENDLKQFCQEHPKTDILYYEETDHLIMLDKPEQFIEDMTLLLLHNDGLDRDNE